MALPHFGGPHMPIYETLYQNLFDIQFSGATLPDKHAQELSQQVQSYTLSESNLDIVFNGNQYCDYFVSLDNC